MMKQVIRLVLVALAVVITLLVAPQEQAGSSVAVDGHLVSSNSNGAYQLPSVPPLFLFNKEANGTQTLTDNLRFQFQLLSSNRIVPRGFCFKNTIRLTLPKISCWASVSLFIREHALLC